MAPSLRFMSRRIIREILQKNHDLTSIIYSSNLHKHHSVLRSSSSSSSLLHYHHHRHHQQSTFHSTSYLQEEITMKVPTMGDSITEGTIVEWAVGVGEAVKEGDVIVLVETDKVTIDIKADFDGVIVEHFGGVDDTVEVGADLYKIDTEATASVTKDENNSSISVISTSDASEGETKTNNNNNITMGSEGGVSHGRKPSIQFLGKMGWKEKLSVVAESSLHQPVPQTPMKANGAITLDGAGLKPTYGRLPFSEREIEALLMGGASEVSNLDY